MFSYLYSDMVSVMGYFPYGLLVGAPVAAALIFAACRDKKTEGGRRIAGSAARIAAYSLYLGILLVITFFSREYGSRSGVMDLELFSTWGINDRNNALIVENVLLFVPYGFLSSLAFPVMRRFIPCAVFGAATSFLIEFFQLVTRRGYFQIDDILTNILGTVIGYLCFFVFPGRRGKK